MADLSQLPDVTLNAEDAHFLAVRLRRLCKHFNYTLPQFAEDDAALVNIAGTVIGALLTNLTHGVTPAAQPERVEVGRLVFPAAYDEYDEPEIDAFMGRMSTLQERIQKTGERMEFAVFVEIPSGVKPCDWPICAVHHPCTRKCERDSTAGVTVRPPAATDHCGYCGGDVPAGSECLSSHSASKCAWYQERAATMKIDPTGVDSVDGGKPE